MSTAELCGLPFNAFDDENPPRCMLEYGHEGTEHRAFTERETIITWHSNEQPL